QMQKIEGCTRCGHCAQHCPYGLDTPALLAKNWADYQDMIGKHKSGDGKK
ncbi:MAG: hypothetical protein GX044_04575, partial [Firmicutes bacterium]|nr:hypothetical protein [Bacillota bacterium]